LFTSLDDDTLQHLGGKDLPPNWREQLAPALLLAKSPLAESLGLGDFGRDYEAMMASVTDQLKGVAKKLVVESGAAELIPCIESGALTLSDAGLDAGAGGDNVLEGWIELLQRRLHDSRSRLLFDNRAGDLVASMLAEGMIDSNELGLKHAGQAAVGAGLVARLPAFPQAPMDELLDLRSDLAPALARYRRAVFRLSKELPASVGPELKSHVDDLWMAEIAPAITEIEERLADHGLVHDIAKSAASDVKALLLESAGVYIGMTSMAGLSDLISATAAAGTTTAQAVIRGTLDSVNGRQEARHHDLFYLYETNRMLTK
jgi:hypothetical protein